MLTSQVDEIGSYSVVIEQRSLSLCDRVVKVSRKLTRSLGFSRHAWLVKLDKIVRNDISISATLTWCNDIVGVYNRESAV